jgi:uncharacterized membrane protein HdeD (DUF308 family)
MNSKNKIICVLAGLFAGALALWFSAYNEVEVFGIDKRIVLAILCLITGFVTNLWLNQAPLLLTVFIVLGVLVSYLLRVFFEITFLDNTSNNLWPLGIIIYGVIGEIATLPGAFLGKLITEKSKK